MEKLLQITKAPIAKIWHVLKAKAIAALEKYVSVSTFVLRIYVFDVKYIECFYAQKTPTVVLFSIN